MDQNGMYPFQVPFETLNDERQLYKVKGAIYMAIMGYCEHKLLFSPETTAFLEKRFQVNDQIQPSDKIESKIEDVSNPFKGLELPLLLNRVPSADIKPQVSSDVTIKSKAPKEQSLPGFDGMFVEEKIERGDQSLPPIKPKGVLKNRAPIKYEEEYMIENAAIEEVDDEDVCASLI